MSSQLDPFLATEQAEKSRDRECFIRGKIVAICESVLTQEIGVISGSRKLSGLGLELYGDRNDEFVMFDGVASETDHLPVDSERANWSAEALQRKDQEIAQVEAFYKEEVFTACRKLIENYRL
jgi:hypothetical protein